MPSLENEGLLIQTEEGSNSNMEIMELYMQAMRPINNSLFSVLLIAILNISVNAQWNETQKVTAVDAEENASFGFSVGADGDWAVVGAHLEGKDESASNSLTNSGAVYVLKRNESGVWEQFQKLVPADREEGDLFGYSVGISGSRIIIGAPKEDHDFISNEFASNAGSVYFFEYDPGVGLWLEVSKISSVTRNPGDYLGISVSIDNDYAVAGSGSQKCLVFGRTEGAGIPGNWSVTQELSGGDTNLGFGRSVSIGGDFVITSSYSESKLYIYHRYSGEGAFSSWQEHQTMNVLAGEYAESYGSSLSMSNDQAVIGGYYNGSVDILQLESGLWNRTQHVTLSDNEGSWDLFGHSVDISGDYLVIGTDLESDDESGNGIGSIYLFEKDESEQFVEAQKMFASDWDLGDRFGISVATSEMDVFVGADSEDNDGANMITKTDAGSVYVITKDESQAYYWVGGTGNWSDPLHWATRSGGNVYHTQPPSSGDDVFFDENSFGESGQVVTLNVTGRCRNLDWSLVENTPTLSGDKKLTISGSLILSDRMVNDFQGDVEFDGAGDHSIQSVNQPFPGNVIFDGIGKWVFEDPFESFGSLIMKSGNLNTNNQLVRVRSFWNETDNNVSKPITVSFGSSKIEITGNDFIINKSRDYRLEAGTSTIEFLGSDGAISVSDYFEENTISFHNVKFNCPLGQIGSAGLVSVLFNEVTLLGDGFFTNGYTSDKLNLSAGHLFEFEAGKTYNIGSLNAIGAVCLPINIESNASGQQATLSVDSDSYGDFLRIKDIHVTGKTLYAGSNGQDNGGNTGTVVFDDNPEYEGFLPDRASACLGEAILLDATHYFGGVTYEWNDGSTQAKLEVMESGVYGARVDFGGQCEKYEEVTVTFLESVSFSYPSSPFVVGGENPLPQFSDEIDDAITFSEKDGLPGLVMDISTGEIDLTASEPGDYTVVATGVDCLANTEFPISIIALVSYYWVGGSGEWSDVSHWAIESGGDVYHTALPGPEDDVFFDANSFDVVGVVTLDQNATCRNMDWSGALGGSSLVGLTDQNVTISGSLTLEEDISFKPYNEIVFNGKGDHTITSAGHHYSCYFILNGSGKYTLTDPLIIDSNGGEVHLYSGSLDTNDQLVDIGGFSSSSNSQRTLMLGSSLMILQNFSYGEEGFELNSGTSTIRFEGFFPQLNDSYTGSQSFHNVEFIPSSGHGEINGSDKVFNKVTFVGNMILQGDNTYGTMNLHPGDTLHLMQVSTQTIETLNARGAQCLPIRIESYTDNEKSTIRLGNNTYGDFLSLQDIEVIGEGTLYTGNGVGDQGRNIGNIVFNDSNYEGFLPDQINACKEESILLDATHYFDGVTYEWTDGSTGPTLEVTASGVYGVEVDFWGQCEKYEEVTITFNDVVHEFGFEESAYCIQKSIITPFVTVEGVTFSVNTSGLALDPTTGSIDLSASTPGEYVISVNERDLCFTEYEFILTLTQTISLDEDFLVEVKNEDCGQKGQVEINRDAIHGATGFYYVKLFDEWGNWDLLEDNTNKFINVPAGIYELAVVGTDECYTFWSEKIEIQQDENDCNGQSINVLTPYSNSGQGTAIDLAPLTGSVIVYDRWGTPIRHMRAPAEWNARDDQGIIVPMGLYVVVSENGRKEVTVIY